MKKNSQLCQDELMTEGALTSFTVCDSYRYYASRAYTCS